MTQGFVNPYTYATSAPTVTSLTSGSGTYTTPAGVKFLIVQMVGGGGGGAGSGATGGTGGTGGSTAFGTATAAGGAGGVNNNTVGGAGGAPTTGTIVGTAITGATGDGPFTADVNSVYPKGGMGGVTPLGGAGAGSGGSAAGNGGNAIANTGSGGGGAGGARAAIFGGAGGGAGAYICGTIASPAATYSYSVGAGGASGTAGTSGQAGGTGGSGVIYVYEYYEVLGIPTTLTLPLPIANGGTGTSVAPSTFYVNTANTTVNGLSVVKYSNVVNDSASAYSTSTGLYTIPLTGWYMVNANIKFTNYNYGAGAITQMNIYQNSTVIASTLTTPTAYNSTAPALNAGTVYKFTAGDTVSVQGFGNLGGASTTLDNSVTNFLSINFLHT